MLGGGPGQDVSERGGARVEVGGGVVVAGLCMVVGDRGI